MARRRGVYGSRGGLPREPLMDPEGLLYLPCGSFLQGARWDSERLRGFRPEDGGVGRERRHSPGTPSTGVSTVSPPCGRTAEGWCLFHARDSPGSHRGLRTHTHPPAPGCHSGSGTALRLHVLAAARSTHHIYRSFLLRTASTLSAPLPATGHSAPELSSGS